MKQINFSISNLFLEIIYREKCIDRTWIITVRFQTALNRIRFQRFVRAEIINGGGIGARGLCLQLQ